MMSLLWLVTAVVSGVGVLGVANQWAGVGDGSGWVRVLFGGLGILSVAGSALTWFLGRRLVVEVMAPVAAMKDFVLLMQAGNDDTRLQILGAGDPRRPDEVNVLAGGLNAMAEQIARSNVALTVRSTHDALTGLVNRTTLGEHLAAVFRSGSERRARQESLLFIDIDDFSAVNDAVGHEGGDAVLTQLAARLNGCVRPHDLVARLGGDQFAILVTQDQDARVATEVAERVLDALRAPMVIGGQPLVVTVSIGVAQRRPDTAEAAELLRQGDFAMYMAKAAGKAGYQLFDAQVHDDMLERAALTNNLTQAVAAGQLRLEYQPVADLRTGEILGVEALVRWQHPTLGLLTPQKFLPLAEDSGDIDAIGSWVLQTATRQVAAWRQTMDHCASLWVSVNLSALQLTSPASLAAIQQILTDPQAEAEQVVLEVSETTLAAGTNDGIEYLHTLKALGVRIAIDDFGTGFSSLSTLADLPVDILKIHGSFVSGQSPAVPDTGSAPAVPILQGILSLASTLSLSVIAEGIEEPEQLDLLRWLGCSMGQGYLLAWPASAHALEAMLASGGLLQLGPSAEVGGTGS